MSNETPDGYDGVEDIQVGIKKVPYPNDTS